MTVVFQQEALRSRCNELRTQFDTARRRYQELLVAQDATRQRRAEVRAKRMQMRSESADRLAEHRDRGRAAAALLEAATRAADIPMIELWMDYFSLGGNRSLGDFRATMEGRMPIDRYNHDLVAVALNERLREAGFGSFLAYWDGSRSS